MSRMERGAEHQLRSDLARLRDADVLDLLREAVRDRDHAREDVVRAEMDRRGLSE